MEVQWKFHVTPNRVIFVQKRKFKNIKEAKEALRTKHEGEKIVFIGEYKGEDLKKHEPRDSKRVIPRG
jgi:hypothetical protein